jgi:hypothetical protein
MATRKRLVLFVEGEGDERAVLVLIKRLLTDQDAWRHLTLENQLFRVGEVAKLIGRNRSRWVRLLEAAAQRPNLGGVLLVFDGDARPSKGQEFCPVRAARELARHARPVGAGTVFSFAAVLACREFESWLLACVEPLAGRPLPDGRPGIRAGTTAPAGDLEMAPRDAKGWLQGCMEEGYKPARNREALTQMALSHLDLIRQRNMRSFRRLENAVQQLVEAIRSGNHVATPQEPAP